MPPSPGEASPSPAPASQPALESRPTEAPPPRPRRESYDWHAFWRRNSGYILIVAITALATLLRLWQLGDIPPGLHGDEAWTGIDAHRVLDDGNIGPYVESALGQPAGTLYWAAIVLSIIGDGVFQLRFATALLGIATIPVTYLAARVMFDSRRVALLSALVLALMQWHLLYSRVALNAVSVSLLEMLTVLFLFLALKLRNQLWFASAGLALGAGLYTANVYPAFIVAIAVFSVLQLLQARPSRRVAIGAGLAILVVCAVIVALPLIRYANSNSATYNSEHNRTSLTKTLEWQAEDYTGRLRLVGEGAWDYAKLVAWGERPNLVDATGRKPALDWLTLLLVGGGVAYCFMHWWKPESQLFIVTLIVVPLGTVIWYEASARTTVGLTPFFAMLAALTVDKAWSMADETARPRLRRVLRVAIPAALVALAVFNLGAYFQDFGKSDTFARFVYAEPIAVASEYAREHPGKPYVYFFSGRWTYDYETRRYLAPEVRGEDRSTQFGRFDLQFDRSRNSLIILMPPYLDVLPQLRNLHPEAQVTTHERDGDVLFTSVYLPAAGPR
jgi:4-amino-4-deoxy-L-arabinose transferase-like glycosyltransferase